MKKTIEDKVGDSTIRVIPNGDMFRGTIIRNGIRGEILEDNDANRLVARLRNAVGKLHPDYVGIDGAQKRFHEFFPDGFADPLYLADERSYKDRSIGALSDAVSLESALDATPDEAASARHAFVTNMLSPFELARASAVLRGPTGADFVKSAARLTIGDTATGLAGMAAAVAPHGRISWPIATYLPFLWRPNDHMFLKPNATKSFAERTGHQFQYDYDAALSAAVYNALLRLAADTERDLASMNPKDRIDVQSFIWVVGDYGENELIDLASRRCS